jgi:peptidoglycan LD-endopeptidase LytH
MFIKNLRIIACLLSLTMTVSAQDRQLATCMKLNSLDQLVLKQAIDRKTAAAQFAKLMGGLRAPHVSTDKPQWVFPLKGYNKSAIGGVNGNGYQAKGYNYLDGNKHTAHPAHDIFINDRNQDGLDDKSHLPVEVLSVDDGIVIACEPEWKPGSSLRGGKFMWIYHPQYDIITYYAHNQVLFVRPGDKVKKGQKIAEVGRTGFSAYQKRSPTHLHFSAFSLAHNIPEPFNPYALLIKAK